jgi:hypothetical protein
VALMRKQSQLLFKIAGEVHKAGRVRYRVEASNPATAITRRTGISAHSRTAFIAVLSVMGRIDTASRGSGAQKIGT